MGANIWSNISQLSTSSSYSVSAPVSTADYRCRISLESSALIFFSTIVTVTMNVYCAPNQVNCGLQDTINNFILVGEASTQIYDVATGCATNGYDDRTSESITLFGGMTYTAFVSCEYPSSEQFAIWIDFNDNFVFESSEMVAYQSINSTYDNPITITIPSIGSGAVVGAHRMRASMAFDVVPNACSTSVTYGETHDYTVNIMAYTCKLFYSKGKPK